MKHEEFCPYAHYDGKSKNCPYCLIIRQEREACALAAENFFGSANEYQLLASDREVLAFERAAETIRARGEKCLTC